jgi:hypothetical protein
VKSPRLLIVAYHFPPEPTAGAQRPYYLARELGRRGWEVTVLTRPSDEAAPFAEFSTARVGAPIATRQEANAPSRCARLPAPIAEMLRQVGHFPDRTVGWIPAAVRCALEETRLRRYDAILSTALPTSTHLTAGWCARIRNLPWIADYRDLWTGNPYVVEPAIRSALQRSLEIRTLRGAAAITAVSPALARDLGALHGRSVHVVMNCHDPEEWLQIPDDEPAAFDLTFTGSLYGGRRRPDILFEAIRRLRDNNDPTGTEATVRFYGTMPSTLLDTAGRYGIQDQVVDHGIVSRLDAMRAQRAAAVLLVLLNDDSRTVEEYGSKIFEYLGARRPILAIGPRSSVLREFIAEHHLGWFASDVDEAADALRELYARYRGGEGIAVEPPCSTRAFADAFAGVVESVIAR